MTSENTASPDIVWEPTAEYLSRSRLLRFMQRHNIAAYQDLYDRSIADTAWFWDAVVRDDLALEWFRPYDRVLDMPEGPAWPRWFGGGRLNYVVSALDRHARTDPLRPAILWEGESGETRRLTYGELHRAVCRLAAGLRGLGIGKGDRVGIFMPMIPETAIAVLACARIGAVYIPAFSGYGAEAVAARLCNAGARLLITADATYRRGRLIPLKETADAAVALAPAVEKVVVFQHTGAAMPWTPGRDLHWHELLEGQPEETPAEEMAPDDPFLIIYTSGTTGHPKGTLHVHGGFPIKAAQDYAHCFDVQPGDTVFWLTDMGWVMGPLTMTSTLILGATLFLYDGTPDYPTPDRLWQLVEQHRISTLGLSPTVIRALMPHGTGFARRHDLSSLRILGSTGEPWNPPAWAWYYQEAGGGRCPVINYSGGTEIGGGILGCTTLASIRSCSFNTPVPGMAAGVVDEHGRPVRDRVGELVIRQPWVGMTHGFWGDRARYEETYWSRFPGVWTHGDWASVDQDGFWYVLGRSDDTLKIAGKRVGPAEIESAASGHPAVREAAAVGVPHEIKHEAVALFVILQPGYAPDEALREEIRQQVGVRLGKAFLPEAVLFADDLPRTRSAKIMRRVVRASHLGSDPGDLSALENPAAIEAIKNAR